MWIMEFITVTTVIPNVTILTQNIIIKQAIVKPGILFLLLFVYLFVCSTVKNFGASKIFLKKN